MTYCGHPRSESEAKAALAIALNSFDHFTIPDPLCSNHEISSLEFLLYHHPSFTDKSTLILCKGRDVIGSLFMYDCDMLISGHYMRAAFISTISILPSFRGKGLSRTLISESLSLSKNKGSQIALVIARRLVDNFYTKFGFYGASQYNRIDLHVQNSPPHPPTLDLRKARAEDLPICQRLYAEVYRTHSGYVPRDQHAWLYLYHKLTYVHKLQLDLVLFNGSVEGYILHDGTSIIFEIALSSVVDSQCLLASLSCAFADSKNITIHAIMDHKVVPLLHGLDLSYTIRECPYGGHMLANLQHQAHKHPSTCYPYPDPPSPSPLQVLSLPDITTFNTPSLRSNSLNIALLDQI